MEDENVCVNQQVYNKAFRSALKENTRANIRDAGDWYYLIIALYFVFLFWAVILAMRVPAGSKRTLHITVALIASPMYVLAHYLGQLGDDKNGLGMLQNSMRRTM